MGERLATQPESPRGPLEQVAEVLANAHGFITKTRARRLLFSLVLTFGLFSCANVAWITNNANDDWALSCALSGRWGDMQGLALYLNAALSQLIFWLNTTFPQFNWFVIAESSTAYLAYFALTYLALSRCTPQMAGVLFACLTAFIVPGCTFLANFTYAAGIACCAGGILLLAALVDERAHPALVCAGIAFFVVGFCWRWQMLLLSMPFFGLAALLLALAPERRARGLAAALVRLWPFVIVLLACVLVRGYSNAIMGQEPWSEWNDYAVANSRLTDYPVKPYEDVAEELESIGVSETDYGLVTEWVSEDVDFFTAERVRAIAQVAVDDELDASRVVRNARDYVKGMLENPQLICFIVTAVLVMLLSMRGSRRLAALGFMALALAIALYCQCTGRLPDRVHYVLWAYAATTACALTLVPGGAGRAGVFGEGSNLPRSETALRVLSGILSCVLAVAFAVMLFAQTVTEPSKMRLFSVFMADSYEPTCAIMDYMDEHPDNAFVFDVSKNRDIKLACRMRAVPPKRILNQIVYIGGWDARAPYAVENNERLGMGNPLRDLAANEDALFVGDAKEPPEHILAYVREHYYPNATLELVDTVSGSHAYGTLGIYRFRPASSA